MADSITLPGSAGRLARKLGLALAAGLGVALAAPSASAYPTFPGYLEDILQLKCAPTCLLCHTDPNGGEDNIKPALFNPPVPGRGFGTFVQNLMSHQGKGQGEAIQGVTGEPSQAALQVALQKLQTEMCAGTPDVPVPGDTVCDSDGDTKLDVDFDLRENQDPDNAAADAPLCIGPYYGCGAHVAPGPAPPRFPDAGALLAALGVALVLARRLRA